MAAYDTVGTVIQHKVACVEANDTLRKAINVMDAHGVSALTVCVAGEVVGIVSDMDVMLALHHHQDLERTTVGSCMTACELIDEHGSATPCVQLDEEQRVDVALEVMAEAGVHNLLVTSDDGKQYGMVSARELLTCLVH